MSINKNLILILNFYFAEWLLTILLEILCRSTYLQNSVKQLGVGKRKGRGLSFSSNLKTTQFLSKCILQSNKLDINVINEPCHILKVGFRSLCIYTHPSFV